MTRGINLFNQDPNRPLSSLASGKWSICSLGANAQFSMIFSKVFKTFLEFFQCCLKIENDVII